LAVRGILHRNVDEGYLRQALEELTAEHVEQE
jgi:hypothetical protein